MLYHTTTGSAADQILKYIEENTDTDEEDNDDMEIDTKECTELVKIDKIYGSDTVKFSRTFIKNVSEIFETINFNEEQTTDKINESISVSTNGKISKLFNNKLEITTRILLVNVVYFKARWKHIFPKEYTYKDNFYISNNSTSVDTMVIKNKSFPYIHVDEPFGSFSIVDIPYHGNSSMMIILPDALYGHRDIYYK
ncbi:serine protease inhibitor-like protein SPI-1 [Yokapox virus]|uniref:Serine protease inhibitor-like protein SPI-1 n=1 Tax=Yokapox virus TaxID=1076255 RepID=G3EI74_9POXV|nr:serine protease inhibitor-like protein SPI-1 [Yokapox virus]AEN03771.1 serine protease inhibitor-like protein SPI-1 [Yokapox virus]